MRRRSAPGPCALAAKPVIDKGEVIGLIRRPDEEKDIVKRGVRPVLVAGGAVLAGYGLLVRPRLLRWGATDLEVKETFPGAELIPDSVRSATMATTIDAPPAHVWPWLVQMGTNRGGWYSWDRLDNFGHRSAEVIHPEWQGIEVGDRLAAKPDGGQWWEVAMVEPERFLGLRMSLDLKGRPFALTGPRPSRFTDSLWGFALRDLGDGRTRLIVSGYWAFAPRWLEPLLSVTILEPSHWVMQTRQFTNLKRRATEARRTEG